MINLKTLLNKLGACKEAVRWTNGMELAEAWEKCERPDWMLWLCGRMVGQEGWPTRQQIVLLACRFAEDALPIYEKQYPADKRIRNCIEVVRKWANGLASIEEVRTARAAAAAAAYADDAAAYAAAAAAYAADAAAAYADAAAAYAAAAAGRNKLKEYADIVRQELRIPLEITK